MSYFGKTFSFVSEDNYDQFVDAMKLPDPKLKEAVRNYKPTYKLDKNDDGSFTLTMAVPEKARARNFKPGVQFEEVVSNGSTALTTVTVEGDKYTTVQKFESGDTVTAVIEYKNNEFTLTNSASFWNGGASVATRKYKA